jgi:hypothetical protein
MWLTAAVFAVVKANSNNAVGFNCSPCRTREGGDMFFYVRERRGHRVFMGT